MINDTLRLTFGVELELVLVFHEKRLQQILSQDPKRAEATIIKDLEQRERDALGEIAAYGWVGTLSRYYNSWALENAGTHQYAKTLKDEDIQSKTLKGKDIRRYGIEPLEIAREVLLPIRPNIRIHEGRAKPDDVHIFEDWHITNDYSLIGIDKKQMINDLPDRIPNLEVAEKCM